MTPQEMVNHHGEGLDFVRFGVAGDDDYELQGDVITKGKRPGAASGVIVKPAVGYAITPARRFDIRQYKFVDGPPNTFMVIKQFGAIAADGTFEPQPVRIERSFRFDVTNSFDQDAVEGVMEALKQLPGYVAQ